jgi:hypothetical protein
MEGKWKENEQGKKREKHTQALYLLFEKKHLTNGKSVFKNK